LSGRGLCDELITRPEESYRLCCVVVCDLETSRMGFPYIYDISSLKVKGRMCPVFMNTVWIHKTKLSVAHFAASCKLKKQRQYTKRRAVYISFLMHYTSLFVALFSLQRATLVMYS